MTKYITYFMLLVTIVGCKKDEPISAKSSSNTSSGNNSYCALYTIISSDTNYIPHKKNNHWVYCLGWQYADWEATITLDTIINNKIYFERFFQTNTSHPVGPPYFLNKVFIDSLGNYSYQTFVNGYSDTLLLINPHAVNGDTIYNNPISNIKVVLVNNSETLGLLNGCYHSRVIYGAYPNSPEDYYYKKGIGELYFSGFTLYGATIH